MKASALEAATAPSCLITPLSLPSLVLHRQSSTAVFLSDDLSLLVCGPYVYENDTPQECFLHAKMSLSFLITCIYVPV